MGIDLIVWIGGKIFSKFGGFIAAGAGILFLLWRKRAATARANRAEAQLAGVQMAQEAETEHAQIDVGVNHETDKIDRELAQGDLQALRDKFNQGDPGDPGRS